jgi:hypothetical protein
MGMRAQETARLATFEKAEAVINRPSTKNLIFVFSCLLLSVLFEVKYVEGSNVEIQIVDFKMWTSLISLPYLNLT